MEAKDLMIGDWVLDGNQIAQVVLLTCDGIIGTTFNESSNIEVVEPIPLTPDVLARMGFTIEEVPKYDDSYTEDEYTATMKCVDSRKCEVEIEYKTYWKKLRAFNYDPHNRLGFTSIETQVEYVHELQNIMCLCGIEKEFVI